MESIIGYVQGLGWELAAIVAAAIAALTVLDDTLADVARRIPVIGPILAPIVRRFSARFRTWMREAVPTSAERAVAEAEGKLAGTSGTGAAKKADAVQTLARLEPGLRDVELEREIEAAFRRMVGKPALEEHDASRLKVTP